MDERLGEPHGQEVERHERPGGDREDGRVAGLSLAVLDRVAERVVGGVEQEDDQEADQRRLPPLPPDSPGALRPDRAGEQDACPEDHRDVDRDVRAGVVLGVAGPQVADRVNRGDDEAEQRDGRERHVQIEDLLDEALVGVLGRVEEGQAVARAHHHHGRDRRGGEALSMWGALAIVGPVLVLEQEVEGRVADQEEDQIVEAEQSQPCPEAPVVGAARGQQVLPGSGRRDHQGDRAAAAGSAGRAGRGHSTSWRWSRSTCRWPPARRSPAAARVRTGPAPRPNRGRRGRRSGPRSAPRRPGRSQAHWPWPRRGPSGRSAPAGSGRSHPPRARPRTGG